jgi:glucosamine--fructose-6-phosphate aminotransferase (isomerizing)
MCGVFGIIFDSERVDLGEILIRAARKLTYRGYDSAGFAVFSENGESVLRKAPGKLEEVVEKLNIKELKGKRGIVQLRWATFGEPTEANSQPHYDCDGDIIGAHNGNIVNTISLIEEFKRSGHTVRGTNDGEVVVHAFEKFFDETKDLKEAIIRANKILKGDYAFIAGQKDIKKLVAVKMGSSLYMGVGNNFICCSSDLPSVLELTDQIVKLNDDEFVIYDAQNYQIFNIETGEKIKREPEKSLISIESANLEGFPHFMLKEIYEQPKKTKELYELLENSTNDIEEIYKILEKSDKIYLIGSGTSYHACLIGAYYLSNLANLTAIPFIAGAFNEYYLENTNEQDTVICVSQSGETKDVVNVMNALRKRNKGKIIGVVNNIGSSIAIKSDKFLNIAAGLEISVPATKTFMNQILLFLYLSLYIGLKKENAYAIKLKEEIRKIPSLLTETLEVAAPLCKNLIENVCGEATDFYYLGYGINYGTALEGALKIKEVFYRHCEGMYSSEFKHGPLSIVEKGYPIIFTACKEDSLMVLSHINEITCRGGCVITISPYLREYEENSTSIIPLPDAQKYLTPFINTIATQLIAYYASVNSGIDPDFPRNISKTLTVD